jgi:hypothetical protein
MKRWQKKIDALGARMWLHEWANGNGWSCVLQPADTPPDPMFFPYTSRGYSRFRDDAIRYAIANYDPPFRTYAEYARSLSTLILRYTVVVEVEVPDDFPVTTLEIEKTADWKSNDYRDGRHPFTTELLHDAALRAARHDVLDAIDSHYYRRIEAWAASHGETCWANHERHIESRNALIKRCTDKLGYFQVANGGGLEIAAMWHPLKERYTYEPHVVLCRGDKGSDLPFWTQIASFDFDVDDKDDEDIDASGRHELATRTVFEGREAAEAYAATIASSRDPIVVALPLSELRVGEDRGRLGYWKP